MIMIMELSMRYHSIISGVWSTYKKINDFVIKDKTVGGIQHNQIFTEDLRIKTAPENE